MGEGSKHPWQTWWLVIGPKLPLGELRLPGNIILAPLPYYSAGEVPVLAPPVPKMSVSVGGYVVRYPPRDEVQSSYRLQVDVEADGQDSAELLSTQIVNRFLTSLSLSLAGPRYHAELRKLRRADEQQEYSAWSQTARITPYSNPRPLERNDILPALQLFELVDRDDAAENAYIQLLTAWQLQDTAGAKPLRRSILQHYFLCVETITNAVMSKVRARRNDTIRLEERKFADEFAANFGKRSDKPAAIRQASTKLREIGLQNIIPSIKAAADIMKVPDGERDQAIALYQFRSSSLSHPGRTTDADFDKWLKSGPTVADHCAADIVARAFLVGYAAHALEGVPRKPRVG